MARESLCGKLLGGQDASCAAPVRKYYQQAVVINFSDIDPESVVITETDLSIPEPVCAHNVEFSLKEGKTGYFFIGPETGANYFGTSAKSRDERGYVQYIQNVNMLAVGGDEAAKCVLTGLDKGLYVVALQLTDGTVEIYGIRNGLATGDYTLDIQTNGGATPIILSSLEATPEAQLPYIYKSGTPGSEGADFDDAFANTGS